VFGSDDSGQLNKSFTAIVMSLAQVTIPARLAQVTRASTSIHDARHRVIEMYRDWYRAVRALYLFYRIYSCELVIHKAPEIVDQYALDVSPTQLRHAIRMRFEANRNVTDVRAIDVLLLKSRQEYQETLNMWKQPDHIYGIMLKPKERPTRTFLQKFYEGASCFRVATRAFLIVRREGRGGCYSRCIWSVIHCAYNQIFVRSSAPRPLA
jgi:NADH dehydrogenase (ubiquinone) 1 alpha subcomplex subunit 6